MTRVLKVCTYGAVADWKVWLKALILLLVCSKTHRLQGMGSYFGLHVSRRPFLWGCAVPPVSSDGILSIGSPLTFRSKINHQWVCTYVHSHLRTPDNLRIGLATTGQYLSFSQSRHLYLRQ
jgi:hypothetical protein